MGFFTWFIRRDSIIERYNHKMLRDYTDDELYEILKLNHETDLRVLAGISSEVLRRMIEEKRFNVKET